VQSTVAAAEILRSMLVSNAWPIMLNVSNGIAAHAVRHKNATRLRSGIVDI